MNWSDRLGPDALDMPAAQELSGVAEFRSRLGTVPPQIAAAASSEAFFCAQPFVHVVQSVDPPSPAQPLQSSRPFPSPGADTLRAACPDGFPTPEKRVFLWRVIRPSLDDR
jgi:hypothetical protein